MSGVSEGGKTSGPREFHLVVNGSAGSVHRERVFAALKIGLPQLEPKVHEPATVFQLQKLIRSLPTGEDLVIAGGDGTLQCALPTLVETQRPFVVLPLGTANDFATHWGFTPDLLSIYHCLNRRVLRRADVIQCNDVYFATVGGLGVGSYLTRDFNAMRRISPMFKKASHVAGTNIYTGLAAATIVGRRAYLRKYEIETDEGQRSGLYSNVFICNQPRLGGDLLVAPQARSMDGRFDVLLLKGKTPYELLASLAKMRMKGEPMLSERVKSSEMVIRALDGMGNLLFADGESFELESELRFKVHHQALHILTAGDFVA
ncbi:MAG: diacylglycerol/lipid kinase family protein [Silvanigrellaceae bacterium]